MTLLRSTLKRPAYLLLPIATLVLACWAFWPRALPVEMATARRAPLSVSFSEEGRTRVRQKFRISAPVDGFLQRIVLEPGDEVKAGTVVAMLRSSSARLLDPASQAMGEAELRAAEQALAVAEASLLAARAENTRRSSALVRAESLAKQKLIPVSELDMARAAASTGRAEERSGYANVERSRALRDGARIALQLQGTRATTGGDREVGVRSPVAGRVVQRYLQSEGPVQAGQPLFEIGDPADLEVEVEVLSADAVRIGTGTPVQLTRWGGDAALPGKVRIIEPGAFTKVSALGVEEQRVRAIIAILAPPGGRRGLGDGYRVDARFRVWHDDAVLQIPIGALFRDGDSWAVYAVENGRARLRRVVLGHFGEEGAELRGGLREGAQVVMYPGDKLRDGTRVVRDDSLHR